jgi:UDP-galactopyranose mutase
MKKALVIGGGFGGCTAVHELKRLGWHVTLAEPASRLGGGVRTKFYSGHPCTLGPRHFLTHNVRVFEYLADYLELRLCKEHKFISFVDDDSQFYSYPIHYDDLPRMPEHKAILSEVSSLEAEFRDKQFRLTTGSNSLQNKAKNYEDFWERSVGPTLYRKFIKEYTKKMWMVDDNKCIDDFTWSPKGVAIKRGPKEGWDTALSAYPMHKDGYNRFFDTAESICDNRIKAPIDKIIPGTLRAEALGNEQVFDIIINTAPIDELLDIGQPKLRYIGRRVEYLVLPCEYALPKDVYFAYYTGKERYTRVVEYKKFTRHPSPNTLISLEYPEEGAGKYYPMPTSEWRGIHSFYAGACHGMMFNVGRIARYNYRYDIDDVIEQVLSVVDSLE